MRTPYEAADKAIPKLKAYANREFVRTRLGLRFDEINASRVFRETKALYKRLDKDAKAWYEKIAVLSFDDAIQECVEFGAITKEEAKRIRDAFGAHKTVQKALESYGVVTKYVYANEVDRKQSRLAEAVISDKESGGRTDILKDFNTSLNYWIGQITQAALDVEDLAVLTAYELAGVEKVVWMTEEDDKVCDVCEERDQEVFDIDDVPPKPHYGCRCWLELATDEGVVVE